MHRFGLGTDEPTVRFLRVQIFYFIILFILFLFILIKKMAARKTEE